MSELDSEDLFERDFPRWAQIVSGILLLLLMIPISIGVYPVLIDHLRGGPLGIAVRVVFIGALYFWIMGKGFREKDFVYSRAVERKGASLAPEL